MLLRNEEEEEDEGGVLIDKEDKLLPEEEDDVAVPLEPRASCCCCCCLWAVEYCFLRVSSRWMYARMPTKRQFADMTSDGNKNGNLSNMVPLKTDG